MVFLELLAPKPLEQDFFFKKKKKKSLFKLDGFLTSLHNSDNLHMRFCKKSPDKQTKRRIIFRVPNFVSPKKEAKM